MRYVQLLLTPGVRQQALRNILAMTFTRNAAAEMRNRILALLKRAHLGDPDILPLLKERIPLAEGRIREDAGLLVGRILQEYENYQIRTIDSFLARVFKASALELGYSPDMEIALDPGPLLDEAFDRCARDLREGTSLGKRFLAIAEDLALASPAYIWNPFARLQEKLTRLLTMMSKSPLPVAEPPDPRAVEPYVDRLAPLAQQILDVCTADAAGELPAMNKHFAQDLQDAVKKEWRRLLSRTAKDDVLTKPRTARQKEAVGRARERHDVLVGEYRATLQSIAEIDAKAHVRAEFLAARELMTYLDATKRSQGQLTLDDVNHLLAQYLTEGGVPDVYLALGESIYHYCLDEFQDTSPLQWAALRPLLEESLAKEGTLFVVGDTKQSIYGFRDADWRIMRGLEEGRERFPSAGDVVTR